MHQIIVGKSEPATRQIAARARRHVDDRRPRYEASQRRRDELAERFFAAVGDGDLETLESLLAGDVELHGDGGGRAPALARALAAALLGPGVAERRDIKSLGYIALAESDWSLKLGAELAAARFGVELNRVS